MLSGMDGTFFTIRIDTGGHEVFVAEDNARGPWDPTACHAGPPTATLARASERAVPGQRLARLAVDLGRPVPMAGFTIDTAIVRAGRTTSATEMTLRDLDGGVRALARGLHVSARDVIDATRGDTFVSPSLAASEPGPFPFANTAHALPGFRNANELRYPPGETRDIGPTALWMKTVPLLPDEEMSPFQRICPIADCGNAFGRQGDPIETSFVNADLMIALHRDPVGEWMGMAASGVWQPNGVGLSDSVLFDELGSVGRSIQVLVLSKSPG
ncbi:MAG: hypothetical protein JWL72_1179 [Ilumatobacteraceae bacterium]|nr:hypothetical protein [Ilumatobacteraceae bacterium]